MTDDGRQAQRILVLSSELPPGPGGIGAHAHALAVQLAREGRHVELAGPQHYVDDAARDRFNASSPVPVTPLADTGDPLSVALRRVTQIRRLIHRVRPDVVVASGGRILWLASVICPSEPVSFVAVVHGTELGGRTWQRHLTRRALQRAAAVIAVSEYTADLARNLGVDPTRIEVIHNGADGDRFAPDPDRAQEFRERHDLGDAPLIVTVGNVTERKGQHRMVAALPEVVETVSDVRYVMVGQPTDGERIAEQARAAGVEEHVRLLGQVERTEVEDALRAADLFVMTSGATTGGDVEGFGIAVIEAALCGVPAVVTEGTGAAEAVVDGSTGVVAASTPDAIAGAVTSLLVDPTRRVALGDAALERARAEGTWAARVRPYLEVLDRVAVGAKPRIVVVSHTDHYLDDGGRTVGFGPTLRELDQLATLASELVHVAPLHPGPPPGHALPIAAPNVRHVPVPPAGGPRRIDRLLALSAVPAWIRTIHGELNRADIAHVRAPAGIAMVAMVLLTLRRRPRARWIKYAGNWMPAERDAATYRLQRWWLRRGLCRAEVSVNGRWPDQPAFVHTFDNPTLTDDELKAGATAAELRPPGPPWRLAFVGRVEVEKGAETAVEVVLELRRRGLEVTLDVVGDGPLRRELSRRIDAVREGSELAVVLHGWLPRDRVEQVLAHAHILLLPTTASEGFPKVIGEALAFGCVPLAGDVSSIGQVLEETGGAIVLGPDGNWPDAVERILRSGMLDRLVAEGLAAAPRFGYSAYLDRVRRLAADAWGRQL